MALFNRPERRYHRNIFGHFTHVPNEVAINAAGVITRAVGSAAATAASTYFSPEAGTTRSGSSFRTPGSGQGKQVIRKSAGDDTGTIVRRRISTGPSMANSSTQTKRMATDGEEIPVIPPPRNVSKIAPDYTTVVLPYYTKLVWNADILGGTTYVGIRMNSVYDPVISNKADQQPQGRDQWAGIFNYYRVLKSDIKLTWLNNNYQGGTPSAPSSTIYAVGYEFIDAGQEVSNTVDAFMVTNKA